jgi:tetratricopeptide (TPR) repeat protein
MTAAAVGLLYLCAALEPCRAASGGSDAPKVQKLETAKAQFEHATTLKKGLRGLEGEARDAARVEAVAAYRAVREYFADEAALCAEAAFRAGELLRTADDLPGAVAEFGIARDRGAGTDFRVRAMIEIGNVERRAKHAQQALAAYEAVVADSTASARQKDEALLWMGRLYADLERFADARRVWQKVADKGDDPLDRIRAYDQIASVLIETGDLEGAAGVLKRCNEALADVSQEETKLGERVRTALGAMHSIDVLARAIEKRKQDADKVDKKGERGEKSGK